jgi:hypothetical protein
MSDIKVILTEENGWRKLYYRAEDFFKELRNKQTIENSGNTIVPIFNVSADTKVINAMVILG